MLSGLATGGWSVAPLFAWIGVVCLLLVAADGIPDTEQFAGALVVVALLTTRIDPSADPRVNQTVAISRSAPSAYLAFLFRSPPASSQMSSMRL